MKTRFCPSPTGDMHLGNARTALLSALLAHNKQGTFLLRIEDTDKERSQVMYSERFFADLRWLGLEWQEGPEVGGAFGPYWQSERQAIYDHHYRALQDKSLAYPCFCTPEQLAIARKIQRAQGKPPRYPGTCRHLSKEEVDAHRAKGEATTLRFKVPEAKTIQFQDLVKGRQRFISDELGDFIIRRTDGTAPFLFGNAVDDALMHVTHVLRGDDHLTNTPRQLLLLEALELKAPEYGHITLIVGPDGAPLSKRHGSRSIQELRADGYLPQAVMNYLARLGHYYKQGHYLSYAELAALFAIEHLGGSAARFDPAQLLYWQQEAINHVDDDILWQWLGETTQHLIPAHKKQLFIKTVRPNINFPDDAFNFATIFFSDDIDYMPEQIDLFKQAGHHYFHTAITALDEHGHDANAIFSVLKSQLNIKGKALFMPMRVALTALEQGPELAPIFELLGEATLKHRLQNALALT